MDISGIPLAVLTAIKPYFELSPKAFTATTDGNFYIRLDDTTPNSPFFFAIYKSGKVNDVENIIVIYQPVHENIVTNSSGTYMPISSLGDKLRDWLYYVKQYNEIRPIFNEDPFIRQSQESFFTEFQFVDDEYSNRPLTPEQLLIIDEHLDFLLEKAKELTNEQNDEKMTDIIRDIEVARLHLTEGTKKTVIERITEIWAKLTKSAGAKFLREFTGDLIKENIKAAINKAINNPEIIGEWMKGIKKLGQ